MPRRSSGLARALAPASESASGSGDAWNVTLPTHAIKVATAAEGKSTACQKLLKGSPRVHGPLPPWRPGMPRVYATCTGLKMRMGAQAIALMAAAWPTSLGEWQGHALWEQLMVEMMEDESDPYDSEQEEWKQPGELGGSWEHLSWAPDGSCFAITCTSSCLHIGHQMMHEL